jgi:hypothetical protein
MVKCLKIAISSSWLEEKESVYNRIMCNYRIINCDLICIFTRVTSRKNGGRITWVYKL